MSFKREQAADAVRVLLGRSNVRVSDGLSVQDCDGGCVVLEGM
jgi:hypothetical protein